MDVQPDIGWAYGNLLLVAVLGDWTTRFYFGGRYR